MAQQVQVQKVFLASPSQWDVWIKAVKTQAIAKEVWSYVDPEGTGPAEPTTPQEVTLEAFMAKHGISMPPHQATAATGTAVGNPLSPTSDADDDVDDNDDDDDNRPNTPPATLPAQPSVVSMLELNATQLYEYKKEDRKWRTQVEKMERQRKNLAELTNYILDRVSDDYRSRILSEQHPRDMIKILKRRVAPTDRAKEIEVLQTWKWLKRSPKDTQLATWLRKWEETYKQAEELKLPEATGIRPVLDFLDAVEPLLDSFHIYWSARIQDMHDEGKSNIPDLYTIIDKFRNYVRLRQL